MHQVDNRLMNESQSVGRKSLDFVIAFLGSLIVGNLGLLLVAQLNHQLVWISYFQWLWLFLLAGLAVFFFTKKRIWISVGFVAAIVLMAL